MKHLYWIVFVLGMFSLDAHAFSPYENYLLSGKPTHVGLMARAKCGQDEILSQQLSKLYSKKGNKKLS